MSKYEEIFKQFNLNLQEAAISQKTSEIIEKFKENEVSNEVLHFLYSCIDFTSLNTDDSKEKIGKLVEEINDFDDTHPDAANVAGICVYPNFISTVKEILCTDVRIVSVAGGFPSSQTFIEVKIAEVSLAVAEGADEIDFVFNCGDFLDDNMEELCDEMAEIKDACRDARLKIILETGLLQTAQNIKKAAILSMYSGADFLKTSTGKVYPGATPEAVYVMCEAIKEYHRLHNKQIGIKVSGGVRTPEDALKYYAIVREVLGEEWLTPDYFRIGASHLATNLLKTIYTH